MTVTCERCLEGRHRCLTASCACTCRGPVQRSRPTAGGVLRTPNPSKPRPARSTGRHVVGMAMTPQEKAAIPGDVLALVRTIRHWQLTGELA